MRFAQTSALIAVLAVAACTTSPEPPSGSAADRGRVALLATIHQSDGFERYGTVVLRRVDPAAGRFLPETKDTLVELNTLPSFRISEVLRGDLGGRTRARPGDLTVFDLAPGWWAIEGVTVAAHGLSETGDSLHRVADDRIATYAFEVRAGETTAPTPLEVTASTGGGRAGARPAFDAEGVGVSLARAQGLDARAAPWRELSVSCRVTQRRPFVDAGRFARCEPRRP